MVKTITTCDICNKEILKNDTYGKIYINTEKTGNQYNPVDKYVKVYEEVCAKCYWALKIKIEKVIEDAR